MTNTTDTAAALAALATLLPCVEESHLWGPAEEALADLAAPLASLRALYVGLWTEPAPALVAAVLASVEAQLGAHVDESSATYAAATAMVQAVRERGSVG